MYSSADIIRQIKSRRTRLEEHVARIGDRRKVYRILVGNPEGKGGLGRLRHRWEDGIRLDLMEIDWRSGGGGFTWLRIWTGGGLS
jgi:hypothetical protein